MTAVSDRKPLRSCARCRKNKIKCDSMETRPGPCSSCVRKGVECNVDYVSPPQRSKEMKMLCDNIRFVKDNVSSLCFIYEKHLQDLVVGNYNRSVKAISCPTRVLKILGKFYVFYIDEDAGSLYINDIPIKLSLLTASFDTFRSLLSKLLSIYFKWDGVGDNDYEDTEVFLARFNVRSMIEDNQLLLLICILNFYFDIPGLNFLEIYDHVLESYCQGACKSNDDTSGLLSKSLLAKLIIGDYHNCHFHSELFIKHFTIYLFLHVVLYGTEHFMTSFMDRYIRTLECIRKKINFDKNWEVKWANFYIRLLNLVEMEVGEENSIDEVELKSMFNGIIDGTECDWTTCFITVVKFNQYLIERKSWPEGEYVRLGLPQVCRKLEDDLKIVSEGKELCERRGFLEIFLCQLLNLNHLLSQNNCSVELKDTDCFDGFTYELVDVVGDQHLPGGYLCQNKYRILKKCYTKLNDDSLVFMERSVGKHYWCIGEGNVVDVVKGDFEAYLSHDDMSLKILKSSCRLIWSLYEYAVYYEMLDRVLYYEPFVWDPQLLLENNGLICQNDDNRVKDVIKEEDIDGSEEPIETILQNVDWIKESADDVLRKIHSVLN